MLATAKVWSLETVDRHARAEDKDKIRKTADVHLVVVTQGGTSERLPV